jgi:uncharacterized protein
VSGVLFPDGKPGRVLGAVRAGLIEAVVSWPLVEELVDVLRRPKLARYDIDDALVEEVLLLLAPMLPAVETEAPVRDPDDAPVVAAAVTGRAEAIVTGDSDLLEDAALRAWLAERRIEVLTPADALARL